MWPVDNVKFGYKLVRMLACVRIDNVRDTNLMFVVRVGARVGGRTGVGLDGRPHYGSP